jgi:pterin-4a-carbinolamine dehydratase
MTFEPATEPFTFFISYRRRDTAPIALLLKYEIEKRLQFVRVLVDVADIRQGDDFVDRLGQMVGKAHATIVLIGSEWMPLKSSDPSGESTVLDADQAAEDDWIVYEILESRDRLLEYNEGNLYGMNRKRQILPIFVNCAIGFTPFRLPEPIKFIAKIQGEQIGYAGWPLMIGPLVERLATNLKLKQRPTTDTYPRPDTIKARTQPLSDTELASTLQYSDYEGWYIDNFGDPEIRYLVKTFKFPDFDQAADFMEMVSKHCKVLQHHPEWRNVFNTVTVSLSTWDARRRVTIYDLNLALFMNKVAQAVVSPSFRRG